jgi:hypothetical protein
MQARQADAHALSHELFIRCRRLYPATVIAFLPLGELHNDEGLPGYEQPLDTFLV